MLVSILSLHNLMTTITVSLSLSVILAVTIRSENKLQNPLNPILSLHIILHYSYVKYSVVKMDLNFIKPTPANLKNKSDVAAQT